MAETPLSGGLRLLGERLSSPKGLGRARVPSREGREGRETGFPSLVLEAVSVSRD